MYWFRIVFIAFLSCSVESLKILVVFPAPARSHFNLANGLSKGLVDAGHEVTIITPHQDKNPPKNGIYGEILLTGYFDELAGGKTNVNNFQRAELDPFRSLLFLTTMSSKMTEITLKHPNVQKLLKSGEKFDVVIVEQFVNDCQKVLAKHFDAALVTFSTIGPNGWINSLVANPSPLSYIPEIFLSYSSQMTFYERVINTLFYHYNQFILHYIVYPEQNRLLKKYISEDYDLYNDVLYNTSIILLNSHPAMNQPVPQVPSMVEIGGFHLRPPAKLPDDLQKFLDEASEGVVYFSMGSNLKSADLPVEKRDAILKAFSTLKQKVLWKWEDDNLPGKPKNVMTLKWMPQAEILAHKNVKLFITHGGLLSTTETTYHGKPILAIPVFGDQYINAKNAVNNGVGLLLQYSELNEENLKSKLEELLNNPKYAENAKKRSQLFHDRQAKPMDTAVFWIEYAARHKGSQHLRIAGVDLPWYRYYLLDVMLFLGVVVLVVLYINLVIFKKIIQKLCHCKSKKVNKTKKNN